MIETCCFSVEYYLCHRISVGGVKVVDRADCEASCPGGRH
jgi:hypothetical protein